MSRWDALRGDSRPQNRISRTLARNRHEEGDTLKRYRSLASACRGTTCSDDVSPLIHCIETHLDSIPPEENATRVVNDIFFSILERTSSESDLLESTSNVSLILGCITLLLAHEKHRFAILAPLTDHVTDTGIETQLTNPFRIRLFAILHRNLTVFPPSATCLSAALRATKAIDPSVNTSVQDLDLASIQSFFANVYQTKDDYDIEALDLLETLVACRPKVSSLLCKVILLRDRRSISSPCSECGLYLDGVPKMLLQLHENVHVDAISRALSILVRNLPLQQWIFSDASSRRFKNTGHMWSFQDRVTHLVEDLLRIIGCNAQNHGGFTQLASIVLTTTPFPETSTMFATALELMERLSKQKCFPAILASCFGGNILPNGSLTQTPLPVKCWVQENRQFLCKILQTPVPSTECLCGLLRAEPALIVNDPRLWETLTASLNGCQEGGDPTTVATLIESLLRGRSQVGRCDHPHAVVPYVLQHLETLLCPTAGTKCHLASCRSLGHLLAMDWGVHTTPSSSRYVTRLLALCRSNTTNQKVKMESYRAIGKLCLTLLSSPSISFDRQESQGYDLADQIMEAILLADARPSIRAMALFAGGNLFQSLSLRSVTPHILKESRIGEMESFFAQCALEKDEKVGVNAFRSLGSLCGLLASPAFTNDRNTFGTRDFVKTSVDACSELLFGLTVPQANNNNMTWKERSSKKKICRAAARCLEVIFHSISESDEELLVLCIPPFDCLLSLSSHVQTVDSKVAASILSALRSMSHANKNFVLSKLDRLTTGMVAATSLFLMLTDSEEQLLAADLGATLLSLLEDMSSMATIDYFEKLGPSWAEKLLQWLATQELEHPLQTRLVRSSRSLELDVRIDLLLLTQSMAAAPDCLEEL